VSAIAAEVGLISLNDLAGSYYFGDGLGVNCNLTLTSQGNFIFDWTGCLGSYDKNKGSLSLKDGVLYLKPKKPNLRQGFQGTPTEFFPVRWDARMYLIPTNEIIEFCSAVNQGREARLNLHGMYYLRQKDWDKPVTGRPAVPAMWAKYFLSQPVSGNITGLIGKQEAWLNLGSDAGILDGMTLTAQPYRGLFFSQVRVEAVEKTRCRIKCEWQDSTLAIGQTVSSRFQE
jgi:hypothetical protein